MTENVFKFELVLKFELIAKLVAGALMAAFRVHLLVSSK